MKNTGKRAGATVAQIYVEPVSPSIEMPTKELKGFERVNLQPGETRRVTIDLNPGSVSYFDVKSGQWQADAGSYNLLLGDSSVSIQQQIAIRLPDAITTSDSE